METGLFGGHADKFYESLLSGGDAGDLPATSGAGGNSGRLATQASLAGSLFYSGGVGGEGGRARLQFRSGTSVGVEPPGNKKVTQSALMGKENLGNLQEK